MASNCQADLVTPFGTGTNQRMTPVAIDASNGFIAAPCHAGAAGVIDVGTGPGEADADDADVALTVKLGFFLVVITDLEDDFRAEWLM